MVAVTDRLSGLRRAGANVMKKNSFRRWKNNKEIGTAPLMCMVPMTSYYTGTECEDVFLDW